MGPKIPLPYVCLPYTVFSRCNFKHYCDILNHHPRVIQTKKFHENKKTRKFGTKNALNGCSFRLQFYKTIVIIEISILKSVENDILAKIVKFDIGSAFTEGQVSTFSEGPGLGPGPLYKICRLKYLIKLNFSLKQLNFYQL